MASLTLIYLFTLFIFIITPVTAQPELDDGVPSYSCSSVNQTTPNSAFQLNMKRLLSYLSSNATAKKQFYKTTVTSTNQYDTVTGIFSCWGNIPPELCSKCVANLTGGVFSGNPYTDCSLSTEAFFVSDVCVLAFSNRSSFFTPDFSDRTRSCSSGSDVSNNTNFVSLLSKTMNETADDAANSGIGYATKQARIVGYQSLFCEAKCTTDLSPRDCRKCLNACITYAQQVCPNWWTVAAVGTSFIGCRVRYDVYPFYRPSTTPAPSELFPATNDSNTDPEELAYLSRNCSSNITADNTFLSNLRTLLSSLNSKSETKAGFFTDKVKTVNGLFMCRGDLSTSLCQLCVQNATQRITSECPLSKEAIIWYNHCLLRYWEGSSLSTLDTTPTYHDFNNILNTSNPSQQQSFFTWILVKTLYELKAVTDDSIIKNYATRAVKLNDHQKLYTLAQCTSDLSTYDCGDCLDSIFREEIPWCCMGSPEGKVLYPSCYIMFGLSKFYVDDNEVQANRQGSPPPPAIPEKNNNRGRSRTIIILIVVLVVVSAILLSFCCYLGKRKARKNKYKTLLRKNFGEESITLEGLLFDLSIVKAATNNFSHENKIGKGGFGEVYKGTLGDGRHIAVKRLSTSSKQGSVEFENEILSIAKLQHRNLVSLIGFCIEDHEQILIYEYMPNGSLDHLLFGTQQQKLNWSERYKIIEGSALGILYLHEYSRLKIIHRDLKPSNILLDENLNPKISDFGMARILEINADRGNTNRIVGTYGYMPPEYAMLGQFSDKSDVFSFGVMILQIITGKKIANLYESHSVMEGLISYVWRRWKDQEPLSILDSHIKENYSQMEVMKCIHIGLLCVQENPRVRPTMAVVISYLNDHSLELPSPREPAFLMDSRVMDQEFGTHQESSSNQADNGFKMFSVNELSTSDLYPR